MYREEFKDYVHFIKRNVKTLLYTSIIVVILVIGLFVYLQIDSSNQPIQNDVVEETDYSQVLTDIVNEDISVEELSESDAEGLESYLDEESSYFRIIIEMEDGSFFRDGELLNDLLLNEEYINAFNSQTSVDISADPDLFINVFPSDDSSSLTLRFRTGNNSDNIIISEYYYDLLSGNSIEFLENKMLTFIESEPRQQETIVEEIEEEQQALEEEDAFFSIEALVVVVTISILGGAVIGITVSIIRDAFSNKLSSIYNYHLYDHVDSVVKLDNISNQDNESLKSMLFHSLNKGSRKPKLILSERPDDLKEFLEKNRSSYEINDENEVQIVHSLEGNKIVVDYKEIFIVTTSYHTSKKWLNDQLEQLKGYNTTISVIRVPEKIYY